MGSNVKMNVDSNEEGEISSMKQQSKSTTTTKVDLWHNNKDKNSNNRNWMRGIYNSYPRGYGTASGLYNLAWAQAVQNKPLNDVFVDLKKDDTDDKKNRSTNSTSDMDIAALKEQDEQRSQQISVNNDGASSADEVAEAVDSEKEGELEEGEIDFDSDTNSNKNEVEFSGMGKDDEELENQVSSIRKVLHNVTITEAHKSFDIVCARLQSSLEGLRELVLHTWFPSQDALIQQSFDAILCVYSVYTSISVASKDQNKDRMSRLLTFVMGLSSVLFTPEQRKKVDDMIVAVNPPVASIKTKSRDRQEKLPVNDKDILTDSKTFTLNTDDNGSHYLNKKEFDSFIHQVEKKNDILLDNAMKQFQFNLKGKSKFDPLLDLHKVHDEDSLPSPTNKAALPSPFLEATAPPKIVHSLQNLGVHPYETEAVKVVSSYKQRFGRGTLSAMDRLPSPTPSEDGNNGGADDSNEEVSSLIVHNIVNRNTSSLIVPHTSNSTVQGVLSCTSAGLCNAGSSLTLRAPTKSQDPRLRHLNFNFGSLDRSFCPSPLVPSSASTLEPLREFLNPKKVKALDCAILDGPAAKRSRNVPETEAISTIVDQVNTVPGRSFMGTNSALGQQLANRVPLGSAMGLRKSVSGTVSSGINSISPSIAVNTIAQLPMNVSGTASVQSLLNIMMDQKKSSEPFQSVSHSANSNSKLGAAPLPTTAPTISHEMVQTIVGLPQVPSQPAVKNLREEGAKLRMKARDPRRALHQKTGSSVVEQSKLIGVHNKTTQGLQGNFNFQRHVSGASLNAASAHMPVLPDITKEYTKNLRNIADIISAPQTSIVQPPFTAGAPSSVQSNLDRLSGSNTVPVKTADQRSRSRLKPEEVVTGRSLGHDNWEDVKHLFERYDDQQKATIQQERARRLDEQKKMFASRKLCLVLDLDHTLLNSAKFTEVDPVHDGILRKKEEQDRLKPRRHLFRFPHLSMWTKLRPGIWNFLEKASKLYELHLYTMGNKLYASEMAKLLDPKGSLFAGRVISRGDDGNISNGDERVPKSKDLEGVLGMESSVVIIDDSSRVWPHNQPNLIVVERYIYFPCSRRQFGLEGPSLLELDIDEIPEEGTLASSLAVIERIHQNFFAHKALDGVDVRNILASEQRKILAGCCIVFSRIFPVEEANPHLTQIWQTAQQFGAVCSNQIDEQVTHVVAIDLGTDKVNWALSTGRFVVHRGWIEASAYLYKRANEQDFGIKHPCLVCTNTIKCKCLEFQR
ncbi:RNA polymerase II C-terminal domain phosphatase-like 3 [Amaranthus tricolor]|uniref:RNA polymerase II C-terminal domain phosphatase-like 3 n=1 Tax=Amaranthus tricolor TaxID=29722 RepID=UPI00258628CE|nr:RNA polymerase II C-terminal domain phosphatase-like 3 [Amaranthus tricolor]